MSDVFYFFRQTEMRRNLVQGVLDDEGARYLLYGMDHLDRQGLTASHNLSLTDPTDQPQGRLAHWLGHFITRGGGLAGDFQTVFTHRRTASRCRAILSSVDTVGIPLVLLNRLSLIKAPLIYVSIGLPERIDSLRSAGARNFYKAAFSRVPRFITYGWDEAIWVRRWLGLPPDTRRVTFVPFGVNETYFAPQPPSTPPVDILSIGADPQRDFASLIAIAVRQPHLSFRLIMDKDRAAGLGTVPSNVEVRINVPFADIRSHLAGARVVALPVHENTYSAGTTTLLQSMAMARPVVVSQTGAIRNGYFLKDGENCRLVKPGDGSGFEAALLTLHQDPDTAQALGTAARRTVEQHLTWTRFEDRLATVIKEELQ